MPLQQPFPKFFGLFMGVLFCLATWVYYELFVKSRHHL